MADIVVTAYYECPRSLSPDELGNLRDDIEDALPDTHALPDGVTVGYLWLEADELQRPAPAYLEKYPLDTPGRVYETIADRIRSGEAEDDVLCDMGLCRVGSEQQGRVAEAARAFAAVTAGLENTTEGAALLAALEAIND